MKLVSSERSTLFPAIEVFREDVFGNNFAFDEMLLDDAFQNGRRTRMIPDSFRINDGDWPIGADAKAIHFAAINQRMRSHQIQFLESLF